MAVLIKGMEMPKSCDTCPCDYDGYCTVAQKTPTFDEWTVHRPSWCPLVEIKKTVKTDTRLLEDAGFEL